MAEQGVGNIFINYRRGDGPCCATALYIVLEAEFGSDRLFMDVEGHIKPGDDFVDVPRNQVAQCDAMLAIVGPRWAELLVSRAEDPDDFVVIEIKAALELGKRVIPLLMGEAHFPSVDILPETIRAFGRRNALVLRGDRFRSDYQKLSAALKQAFADAEKERAAKAKAKLDDLPPLPPPGTVFRHFETAPEVVVVPAGSYLMGSHKDEKGRSESEGPQHSVTISRPLAVSRSPVTFDEWEACIADGGGNGYSPPDNGWGRGRRPVINVSWEDAQNYVSWLAKKAGRPYRLLSEAEWEYAARAGTTTAYSTGSSIRTKQSQFSGYSDTEWGDARKTVAVGTFTPNAFGLYDMHGNVGEWVEDWWNPNYEGAPADGSAWCSGNKRQRVIRGAAGSIQQQIFDPPTGAGMS
jgi:formylglycine-generating enzyme required for sulfatase activity